MSEPTPEIDEPRLRALLQHAARDIAHSRKPMVRLARGGFTGLLMSASVVAGFAGLFWLLGAIFSVANGGVDGFPLGLWGGVCGVALFVAGVGLMRLATGPDRARVQASAGRVRVGQRALSTLVLVVSIVLVYMGASDLVFALITSLAHHSDPDVVYQVALGIPYLAIGLGGMRAATYLRRR
ncbi:MAG: hypothetical protein ABSA40_06655 [Candidatus Dormibacteria bacterium]